ncbi:MAG TPA: sulfite exporter TauE/SafE family protein [Woeseiaceae bacterium]|nr:sulfite exporter TauE/SafE family protein [Woeseiaceae bacterium]
MNEALLFAALAAGFFGSGHCIGMCGAMVLLLERPQDAPGALLRRLVYNAGRLTCYMLLGAVAAAAGLVLTRVAGVATGLFILRMAAALVVVLLAVDLVFGLRTLGFLEAAGARVWRRLSPLAGKLLPATTPARAFGAGFLWGMLPCGLVYAAVALAAGSGSAAAGAVVMAAFWLGTLPALLAAGAMAGRLANFKRRPGIRRAFGVLVLVAAMSALVLPLDHGGRQGGSPHAHAHGTVPAAD